MSAATEGFSAMTRRLAMEGGDTTEGATDRARKLTCACARAYASVHARERATRASAQALPPAALKGRDASLQLEVDERGRKGVRAKARARDEPVEVDGTAPHRVEDARVHRIGGRGIVRACLARTRRGRTEL